MTERLRRFLRLPTARRRLLTEAALLLGGIRIGLRLLPFQTLRRLLTRMVEMPVVSQRTDHLLAERVVWAVESAGRHMPWAKTCLTQALAAQFLLTRRGQPALIHIGVVKGEDGQLQAHAWVESGGRVVIGDGELERYTPLVALEGKI